MKLLDIVESYNTTAELDWKHAGAKKSAFFTVGDETYDIVVGYYTLTLPHKSAPIDVCEVSFGRYVDGKRTVHQTPSASPSKVFGIVYNAILDLMNQESPDLVVFSAKTANDSGDTEALSGRVNLYQALATRLSQHGTYDYPGHPIKSKHAHNFFLPRHTTSITLEELNWIGTNV